MRTPGIIAYLIIFGGAIGVLGKFALVAFRPEALIFLRLLATVIFFTPILFWRGQLLGALKILKTHVMEFLILALSGVGGGMVLGFWGLSKTTAVNYDLLFNMSALFMTGLAVFLLKEKLLLRDVLLLFAAFLGAALIVTKGDFRSLEFMISTGDLLVLAGAMGWAWYSIYGSYIRKKIIGVDSVILVYNTFIVGVAFLLPYIFYSGGFTIGPITWSAVLATLLLGIFATAILFYLWFEVINIGGGIVGGFITLGENIGGVIFPIVLLGERPTAAVWIGGILIIGAVWCRELFAGKQKFDFQ